MNLMVKQVKTYNCSLREKYYNLENAIVQYVFEMYGHEYNSMRIGDFGDGLLIILDSHLKSKSIYISFEYYHLEDDTLIYFDTPEEKILYLREKKLKRITT